LKTKRLVQTVVTTSVIILVVVGMGSIPVYATPVGNRFRVDGDKSENIPPAQDEDPIDWETVPDPRVEAEVLSQGERTPQHIPETPHVFWDDELGRCYISTNIPWELLRDADISLVGSSIEESIPDAPKFEDVYDSICKIKSFSDVKYERTLFSDQVVIIWVKVPTTWAIGEDIDIQFKMYNEGSQTATVSCNFYGYDNSTGFDMVEFSVSGSVNVCPESYGNKNLTVEVPAESVGLKRGLATATGDASYSDDMGYIFVQKFGDSDTNDLPEDDRMSYTSESNNYYWEGLPDIDGFNISAEYSMYHPYAWNITWLAGFLVDNSSSMTFDTTAEHITEAVTEKMTYDSGEGYWSDFRIMNEGYLGKCDEFACLETSCLRALGIPTRQLHGYRPGIGGHSWPEYWGEENGDWSWVHTDPTRHQYNNPSNIKILNYTELKMRSSWDDSYSPGDGSKTDGNLSSYDALYAISYDGPNDYEFSFIDVCEDASVWTYDANWPNPLFAIKSGTLCTSDGYLKSYSSYSDGSGPFYYRELDDPLSIDDFWKLEVEISFSNPSAAYKGCFGLGLYDEDKELICYIILYEWSEGQIDMDLKTRWYFNNGTTNNYNILDYTGSSWHGVFWIFRDDALDGIWSLIEDFSYQQLAKSSDFQNDDREIRYVGIQCRKGSGTFLVYNIHDVRVWEIYR